jgi:glyoxylase-like metal-dependent hydrolase (beta-lactamase superfamily II)
LCPRGGRLLGGAGSPLSPAPMCCHCLLIEGEDGLVLVDTGLGVEDVTEPRRLGFLFNAIVRPRLEIAETALRQVADLGYRPSDVRHIVPTHLDLDHAGGIGDFPGAAVHVFAAELCAASNPSSLSERGRYRRAQIAAVRKWAPIEEAGESWFGFSAVSAIPGTRDEALLIPLPGHTRGHCGVAVRRPEGWLLHCGDAYFHHSEVEAGESGAPKGLRFFESLVSVNGAERRANLARLRELARLAGGEVKLICSHDLADFAAMRSKERQERPAPPASAAPQPAKRAPRPPSTRQLAPVTNEASSDRRNTAQLAISAGLPMRRIGWASSTFSRNAGSLRSKNSVTSAVST